MGDITLVKLVHFNQQESLKGHEMCSNATTKFKFKFKFKYCNQIH